MLRIEICVFFLFHSLWFELHLLARRADANENREEQNGRAKSWEGREGGGQKRTQDFGLLDGLSSGQSERGTSRNVHAPLASGEI